MREAAYVESTIISCFLITGIVIFHKTKQQDNYHYNNPQSSVSTTETIIMKTQLGPPLLWIGCLKIICYYSLCSGP